MKSSCFKNVEHKPESFGPNFSVKEKTEMKEKGK